jgi:hypothetical protein
VQKIKPQPPHTPAPYTRTIYPHHTLSILRHTYTSSKHYTHTRTSLTHHTNTTGKPGRVSLSAVANPFRNSREAYKAEGGAGGAGVDGERTEYEGAQRRRNKVPDPGISVPVPTPPSPFKGGSTGTGIDWDSAPLPPNWERRADKNTAKVGIMPPFHIAVNVLSPLSAPCTVCFPRITTCFLITDNQ